MSNNSNPPFSTGQRVVALKTSSVVCGMCIKKGNVYRVVETYFCKEGNHWFVGLSGFFAPPEYTVKKCCSDSKIAPSRILGGPHTYFAPYDPPKLEIPAELLEEQKTDCIDVIKEKELA